MPEQKQKSVGGGDLKGVSKRWLVRLRIWIQESFMAKDPVPADVAEFNRRLRSGEVRLPTPEERAQFAKDTRTRLKALDQKFGVRFEK